MSDINSAIPLLTFVTVFALIIPIVVSALIGRAKGYEWYWTALLGLLSIVGLLIADGLPPKNRRNLVPDWLQPESLNKSLLLQAAKVKLLRGTGPEGEQVIGTVEVDTYESLPDQSTIIPDLDLSADALRFVAAEVGANTVANVSCFRVQRTSADGEIRTVYRVSGTALRLDPETLGQVESDVIDLAPDSYVERANYPEDFPVNAGSRRWNAVLAMLPSDVPAEIALEAREPFLQMQKAAHQVRILRTYEQVKLLRGRVPDPREVVQPIEIEAHYSNTGEPPDPSVVLDAFKAKAAQIGANAVDEIHFIPYQNSPWKVGDQKAFTVSGMAIRLDEDRLNSIRSEIAEISRPMYPDNPASRLNNRLRTDGIFHLAFAAWGFIMAHNLIHNLQALHGIPDELKPWVVYGFLSIIILLGIALLSWRSLKMLLTESRMLIVIGIAFILMSSPLSLLGLFLVVFGFRRVSQYKTFKQEIEGYERINAQRRNEPSDTNVVES